MLKKLFHRYFNYHHASKCGVISAVLISLTAAPALAAPPCGGEFAQWLDGVRVEAQAAGVSDLTIKHLAGLQPSAQVLERDRAQAVFAQDWQTFATRMVNGFRLKLGRQHLQQWQDSFARAEQSYGVPAAVIAAFWGLETDYGLVQGDFDTLRALATLAHDCRRPELFRPQLLAALQLLERGDVTAADLTGAWAGELGQIQILPSDYLQLGADGDGDGRVNLKTSKADVILTAAHLLQQRGWRAGEPWLEAVQVPDNAADFPWEQAGMDRWVARSQWVAWGVTPSGEQLNATAELPAALLLPMGRKGPAFLAYPNFTVFLEWNRSLVYSTTAAYFATRLAGAPAINMGKAELGLNMAQMKTLQMQLTARGYDVGKIDGVLGSKTRAAVRTEQQRLGLPADAWPTPALLKQLQ
ncbi:lytic murein transglycosylase [Rhodoferax sp. 4810]|uniref:Lytic murein transglycosylase n=1 Tax=Thiospirillum jenense TaxID=1653858 RepID=A0A839HI39_9GAMM|nr:lytic murein transglycosylase [Thiospirillum jenense]MBB1075127.1 lytic murein transglycosylase [Rhodoferax jenense]MBB1126776.1 lytic murein transglycosylase [Thiospirillum jenense]